MKKHLLLLPVFLMAIVSAGCYDVDGDFRAVRNVTLTEYGKNFVTDTEFALGSFELWVAGGIVDIVQSDEMAEEILSNVSEVQVGIYKNKGRAQVQGRKLLEKIDRQMDKKGWKFIVKNYSRGEMTAVYLNKDYEKTFRELFVISIEDEEMTIVNVTGDLERVIETAIREHGIKFNNEDKRLANR